MFKEEAAQSQVDVTKAVCPLHQKENYQQLDAKL